MTSIFVFGNPDIAMDALPVRMLPELKKRFPGIDFRMLDPNEEWEVPPEMIIIDAVVGITEVRYFDGLEDFAQGAHVSMHDFDAYTNLRFLKKLGKIKEVKVIGVPAEPEGEALFTKGVIKLLEALCGTKAQAAGA